MRTCPWIAAGLLLAPGFGSPVAEARPALARPLLSIRTYSVDEGLPSAMIYELVQDGSGHIWILSRVGISAYDGQTFEPHGAQRGLPQTSYRALAVDEEGHALAAAQDGRVFRYEEGAWKRLAPPPVAGGFAGQVRALASAVQRGHQQVLLGTSNGLWLWEDGSWARLGRDQGLPAGTVTALSRLDDGVAVGTEAGLCRLQGRALDCSWRDKEPLLRERILAATTSVHGGRKSLLFLTSRRLGALEGDRMRLLARELDPGLDVRYGPDHPLAAIGVDPTGAVFFGTQYRALLLEPGEREPQELGPDQGLPGRGVTTILADREGGIWIGGLRGLTRVGSRRFLSFDAGAGLADDEVTAVAELPGGRFVVGHNAALSYLDGLRLETERLPDLTSGDKGRIMRVLDLAADSGGTVWAAAALALLEIRPDRSITIHSPAPRTVSVETDRQGRLWILDDHAVLRRRGLRFENVPLGIPARALPGFRWLATDGLDRLFVTSTGGLLWREGLAAPELDPRAPWRWARSRDGKGDNVYAVLADRDPVLVGTAGGLYRLEGQVLERSASGLELDRPVYFLLRDRAGHVWAGTDDGVFVADGGGFRQLTVRHGLVGRETNRGAGLVDSRGQIWIGTDRGLSIYREALDLRPAAPPTVEIDGVEVAGERYPATAPLELAARPKTLVFHARAISFSPEETVLCRYQLEGFDDDWQGPVLLTQAGLRYTQVPPGRYRLSIAAGWGRSGPWGAESRTAEIRIPTPLWQRPEVWVLSALALGAVLTAGHQLRLRRLHRRNLELESLNVRLREGVAERQRLIGELEAKNSELERFAYTVSHDLKSPLVTIRGFLGFIERDSENGNLARVRADIERIRAATETMTVLLNQLLELSRVGRVVGPREVVPLAALVREAAQRVAGMESAELVVAPDLPAVEGDRTRLLEVFENLLANAVKFMGGQTAPKIEVGVRSGPEPVIYVADNGVGIAPRFQQRVFGLFERLDSRVDGTGVGLAVVKRIVEFHGGRIWVESEGIPGKGSRFCLVLPGPAPKPSTNEQVRATTTTADPISRASPKT